MADVTVNKMTVGEYLPLWLAAKRALKPTTASLYADLTKNYLLPHLGSVRLLELRAHHLDRMYQAIELAPENNRRPKPWTVEQCQHFLAETAHDRLNSLFHLMIVTGMRRGETVGLRWEDIDLDGECLFVIQQITDVNGRSVVSTPKTKRGQRLVPIDRDTIAMLRRHREAQDLERSAWGPAWNEAGLVFTREDGHPLRPEYATKHFRALTAEVDLRAIRLHDLRHTNASLALAAGVDLKVVSERLGHSQLAITADLYTHVNRQLGRTAAEQIATALRDSRPAVPTASLPQGLDFAAESDGEGHG